MDYNKLNDFLKIKIVNAFIVKHDAPHDSVPTGNTFQASSTPTPTGTSASMLQQHQQPQPRVMK